MQLHSSRLTTGDGKYIGTNDQLMGHSNINTNAGTYT